jgi:hypothetical protein
MVVAMTENMTEKSAGGTMKGGMATVSSAVLWLGRPWFMSARPSFTPHRCHHPYITYHPRRFMLHRLSSWCSLARAYRLVFLYRCTESGASSGGSAPPMLSLHHPHLRG